MEPWKIITSPEILHPDDLRNIFHLEIEENSHGIKGKERIDSVLRYRPVTGLIVELVLGSSALNCALLAISFKDTSLRRGCCCSTAWILIESPLAWATSP